MDLTSDPSRVFVSFAGFVVAVIVGLLVFPIKKLNKRKHTTGWITVCVLLLLTGACSFFIYENLRSAHTAKYRKTQVVIGSEFTPEGLIHHSAEPGISNQQMLMDAAGNPAQIWTAASIRANSLRLRLSYLASVITLAGCIITVIQVVDCSTKRS